MSSLETAMAALRRRSTALGEAKLSPSLSEVLAFMSSLETAMAALRRRSTALGEANLSERLQEGSGPSPRPMA
jgi:hypothetical protein